MILALLYLQNIRSYTTLQIGFILLPQALSACIIIPIAGMLFDKIEAKVFVVIGITVATIVLFMLSNVSGVTSVSYILICLISIGSSSGLIMMPLNSHILQVAPKDLISRVTPLIAVFEQVIFSFAIAGMTGFLTSRMVYHLANTNNKLNAAISSYDNTFLLCACIAFIGVILSLFIIKPEAKVETETNDDSNI